MQLYLALNNILKDISFDSINLSTFQLKRLSTWFAKENLSKFMKFYYRLDDASQSIFLRILRNCLGYLFEGKIEKYHYISDAEYEKWVVLARAYEPPVKSYLADVIETFFLKGYECGECKAQPGNIVLDCGAYTGNTSIYFADLVGDAGHVYAFEAMPKTFEKLRANLEKISYTNITPINSAVDKETGQVSFINEALPSSRKSSAPNAILISSIAIDDFVINRNLKQVDFIKMDVEGAELDALIGARYTIQKYKPILAICIYHKADDFMRVLNF